MKLRKIIAILLVFVMCFVLAACGNSGENTKNDLPSTNNESVTDSNKNEDKVTNDESVTDTNKDDVDKPTETEGVTPLLYKVTDKKGNTVWLFGSIHVGEKDFYPLPDYVLNAFDNADSLAVEFDIVEYEKDQSAATETLAQFVITDGRTIKDFIPTDVYEAAKKILTENGFYTYMLDYYMPMLWSSLIDDFLYEKIDVKVDLGIDRHLINRAYEKKMEVLDVESAEFQYGMLAGFSEELQALLLKESIAAYNDSKNSKKEIDELISLWAAGDEKEFAKILNETEFENEHEKKLYEEYNNAMIVKRNKSMTNWAENALKSGKEVFICVGAAHVVGPGAMAEMLKNRGYTVELVK